jgi:outer membrane beta-barrel protein
MHFLKALPLLATALALSAPALAGSPGLEAMKEFKEGESRPGAIQNRFFLKEDRFEISPMAGYVPNNPFAKRYVPNAIVAYHFSEELAAEGQFQYSPDAGVSDLKGLAITLVQIAQTGAGDAEFQQPLDKTTLAASFGVRYSPLYGKINLVGETVLNFDVYGTAGLGMVTLTKYYARFDSSIAPPDPPVALVEYGNEVKVAPSLGAGADFFLSQSVALKIDARMGLYVADVPDYEPETDNPTDGQQRLYNNFVASAGVSFFFPKMQPRLYNF